MEQEEDVEEDEEAGERDEEGEENEEEGPQACSLVHVHACVASCRSFCSCDGC